MTQQQHWHAHPPTSPSHETISNLFQASWDTTHYPTLAALRPKIKAIVGVKVEEAVAREHEKFVERAKKEEGGVVVRIWHGSEHTCQLTENEVGSVLFVSRSPVPGFMVAW